MTKVRAIYAGCALVWGYIVFACAYSVATGNGWLNSIEYGTAGRIEMAVFTLGALAYGIWVGRKYLNPLYRSIRDEENES